MLGRAKDITWASACSGGMVRVGGGNLRVIISTLQSGVLILPGREVFCVSSINMNHFDFTKHDSES